jgi:peptidoglycan/LPS O-acetylase OafA/YrhL
VQAGAHLSQPIENLPPALRQGLGASHLPALDGLRAIAAFLVVFFHYGFDWCPAGLGVLAFFVLSGFLITWLLLKEEEHHGSISVKLFYTRRSLRIFPAFYVFWFLYNGLVIATHKHFVLAQSICSFFYVNNYYQGIFGDPNTGLSHTWSLGIEEQFYLLWPLTFLLLKRTRPRMIFLISAIAAVWIYREILSLHSAANSGYIYEAFDTRADHLAIGCLLAVALRAGAWRTLWTKLCSSAALVWLTLALLVFSTILANTTAFPYRDAVGFIVDPLLIAVLIVQCIATPRTGFGAMLNWRWMRYLGAISYSIYLYQQVVIDPIKKRVGPSLWISLPMVVAVVIIVSSGSYHFIEKPFLRLKTRFAAD